MLKLDVIQWRVIYSHPDPDAIIALLTYVLDHGPPVRVPRIPFADPWLERVRRRGWRKSAPMRAMARREARLVASRLKSDRRSKRSDPPPDVRRLIRRNEKSLRDARDEIRRRVAAGQLCHVRTIARAAGIPERAAWRLRLHTKDSLGYVTAERTVEFFRKHGFAVTPNDHDDQRYPFGIPLV